MKSLGVNIDSYDIYSQAAIMLCPSNFQLPADECEETDSTSNNISLDSHFDIHSDD